MIVNAMAHPAIRHNGKKIGRSAGSKAHVAVRPTLMKIGTSMHVQTPERVAEHFVH
jgi:hypothetical protein